MYNSHCYRIHKVSPPPRLRARANGGPQPVEWANLPHDFAETLELLFVGITIVVTLAILVAFGQWWQR